MPSCAATARASYTSSIEQHRPLVSPVCNCGSRRWFQSCIVNPTMGCRSRCNNAATVDESTPPDIATAISACSFINAPACSGSQLAVPRSSLPAYEYLGDNFRRCATLSTTASTNASTCSSVLHRPNENRILDRASSLVNPIASSTCDGSTAPEEQAAPVDTENPFKSNAISNASPSIPSNLRFDVFGTRSAPAPFTVTCATRSKIACSS